MKKRRWYSGILTIFETFWSVIRALRTNQMSLLIPFFIGLFVVSFILYCIHLVSPLAPFVYSLF